MEKMSRPTAATIANQYACANSDRPMTICVKAGSSAPKPAKMSSNCGTTFMSRMPETMKATQITEIGYVIAFLIFALRDSVFSL